MWLYGQASITIIYLAFIGIVLCYSLIINVGGVVMCRVMAESIEWLNQEWWVG